MVTMAGYGKGGKKICQHFSSSSCSPGSTYITYPISNYHVKLEHIDTDQGHLVDYATCEE
ncbi:Endoribonuclease Dcr-1 [Clarias magur]|uniref:Endoribonuclease Dcr-1 n=1 Tax=Clarias magur TaxID=1594786 RepID=A0A8J4T3Y5_CLAMG|nr:Endoribonuclease Dcr-1 [Clarias magur]